MPGDSLGVVNVLDLGTNGLNDNGLWNKRVLGYIYGFQLGIWFEINLGSYKWYAYGTEDINIEGLLLGAWLRSLDKLKLGNDECNKIGLRNGKFLDTILAAMDRLSIGT